jgi:hypothetical protein
VRGQIVVEKGLAIHQEEGEVMVRPSDDEKTTGSIETVPDSYINNIGMQPSASIFGKNRGKNAQGA